MFGFFKKKQKDQPTLGKEQIVPRIKNENYRSYLRENGLPKEHLELFEPIAGDLYLTYALDRGSMFEMLTPTHLEEIGIKSEELRKISEENFRRIVPSINLQKYGNFYDVQTGNNLEACMLADTKFWNNEAANLKGDLVASAPHRDHMMFCDSSDEEALLGLKEFTEKYYHEYQDNHSLSLNLFSWTSDGWQDLKP